MWSKLGPSGDFGHARIGLKADLKVLIQNNCSTIDLLYELFLQNGECF